MPPRSGPKKTGPDLSWTDEGLEDPNEQTLRAVSPPSNVPGPTFPPRYNIRTPKPLSPFEHKAVEAQLEFRRRCREGPLYTVLDRNSLVIEGEKVNREDREKRGFDVFGGQQRWSTRKVGRARKEPDLSRNGRGDYGYTLSMFPHELWGVLDPEQKGGEWKSLPADSAAFANLGRKPTAKRKKRTLDFDTLVQAEDVSGVKEEEDSEDEDPIRGAGDRKRSRKEARRAGGDKAAGEKQGLDAEDEYDREINPEDEEEEAGEEEPQDSEFEEDDEDHDDYNAENYFDDGEDEGGDDGDGGGGDDY